MPKSQLELVDFVRETSGYRQQSLGNGSGLKLMAGLPRFFLRRTRTDREAARAARSERLLQSKLTANINNNNNKQLLFAVVASNKQQLSC
jgi:hypothetical protein